MRTRPTTERMNAFRRTSDLQRAQAGARDKNPHDTPCDAAKPRRPAGVLGLSESCGVTAHTPPPERSESARKRYVAPPSGARKSTRAAADRFIRVRG